MYASTTPVAAAQPSLPPRPAPLGSTTARGASNGPRSSHAVLSPGERAFRGRTNSAALSAVKEALGDEAIIVSTRELQQGGERVVEVIARPGAEAPAQPKAASPTRAAAPTRTAALDEEEHHSGMFALAPPRPERGSLAERLELMGVAPHIARRVAERAARIPVAHAPHAALPGVLEEVVEVTPPPWVVPTARRRVIAFVGPTGVGKTTTIAKVAARALLESQVDVTLITLDTFRIGAAEHIRRYGEIMDVPTFVVRDARGLEDALERSVRADLVLIDTAGRSPAEVESFERQLELLRAAHNAELHLAVSAGASVRQLRAVRERYAKVQGLSVVVTKVDEADGPGSILNVAALIGRPIAAYTDGQRVPEDVHAMDLAQLAAQVVAG